VEAAVYSFAECVFLGHPVRVEPDALVCDLLACDRTAAWLVPGCALCHEHGELFGIGQPTYCIEESELTGDERWRQARRDEWVERIRRLQPLRRDDRHDRLLEELAARRVPALIASAFE
jgi:hypothetical protein